MYNEAVRTLLVHVPLLVNAERGTTIILSMFVLSKYGIPVGYDNDKSSGCMRKNILKLGRARFVWMLSFPINKKFPIIHKHVH